jgi:hypothetical protein
MQVKANGKFFDDNIKIDNFEDGSKPFQKG